MPVSGGAADKLGNRYEGLWAIDQLLRIIDGTALRLTLEPLSDDESQGIEFVVENSDSTVDYWSVKRQTTRAAGWTLALLTDKDDHGRSILGDLLFHVERDPTHRSVFASTLGAPEFAELQEYAKSEEMLDERLAKSDKLNMQFRNRILPLCSDDKERARHFLKRTRSHAVDEHQLRDRVEFAIRKLLYAPDRETLNVATVRGHLSEMLLENLHNPLDQTIVLDALEKQRIRRRDWAVDRSILDRVTEMCDGYSETIRSQCINGSLIPLKGSEPILDTDKEPTAEKILVIGGAGGGKSTTLAGVIDELRVAGVPVLPVRFDQLPDGIATPKALGLSLDLPESPAVVLAGVAKGAPCVLVVDQLDAVSIASGRRAELWSLFDDLRREVVRFPGMTLIVGCREFDLEHDHRMRVMKEQASGFRTVKLSPLSTDQVDNALRAAGTDPDKIQGRLKPVLTLPLHLSIFLRLSSDDRSGVSDLEDLFDRFWTDCERRCNYRLGRKTAWTPVLDQLTDWLSANQKLSAPRHTLDDFSADAAAMVSEHALVLSDNRYRFFHESFFDYAFARRFATRGDRLEDLLLRTEQHLFRRAQVRQVLTFLRFQDPPRYLDELRAVLDHVGVRFHVKRSVLDLLSSFPDPGSEEWGVLQDLQNSSPEFRDHVRGVVSGKPGWFDVLDKMGLLDAMLASNDPAREEEAVSLFAIRSVLEVRSPRIASLLKKYRRPGEPWGRYLLHVCRTGYVYYSRQLFDLFLTLIEDGTMDGARPGFAVNDNWWSLLYPMSRDRPDLACEAIGRWFDRTEHLWDINRRGQAATEGPSTDPPDSEREAEVDTFSNYLDRGGRGAEVINRVAGQTPRHYAEQLLPRIARHVGETSKECRDRLDIDSTWTFRSFGYENQVHDILLSALARSLEELAKSNSNRLDQLLDPYLKQSSQDTIVYLILRSWAASPNQYADRLADFLLDDLRRLKVGYSMWDSSGGDAANYVSTRAVKVASANCSAERVSSLEKAILSLRDSWEMERPSRRGYLQLELLSAFDKTRLSRLGNAKLKELRRKFPSAELLPPVLPEPSYIDSPISKDAQAKMSDEQWLQAMAKYSGVVFSGREALSGGERELAMSLKAQVEQDPARFAGLIERMPDELPASYFDAILQGIADHDSESMQSTITTSQMSMVVQRAHSLPGNPCGRGIAYLIEKRCSNDWPDGVIDILSWYAIDDLDPDEEIWKMEATSGQPYYNGDPHSAGINSTRGSIAEAIARLLFDAPNCFGRLRPAIRSLLGDRSVAVRSCALGILVPMLDIDAPQAITWFIECTVTEPALLKTPYIDRFIRYAGYRDYIALKPVLKRMLGSGSATTGTAAARICLLALEVYDAEEDAELVRRGTVRMRAAAARVYSANVANEVVGPTCRDLLKPLLADPDDEVRTKAASVFRELPKLATPEQADLLEAYLKGSIGSDSLQKVISSLERSPVQLPDLVCRLAGTCIDAYREEARDFRTSGAGVASCLSKIVVRLYAQTEDSETQRRCLDLIDEMERYHFMGISSELQRLDR